MPLTTPEFVFPNTPGPPGTPLLARQEKGTLDHHPGIKEPSRFIPIYFAQVDHHQFRADSESF